MRRMLLILIMPLILFGCFDFDFGFGTQEDAPDLYKGMIKAPENQYTLTDSFAYTPSHFYIRVPALGETFEWYKHGYGTAGGLPSPAYGRYDTIVIDSADEFSSAILFTKDSLQSYHNSKHTISTPILMDDGSVCYTLRYEDGDYNYRSEKMIWNSQLGKIYQSNSSSSGDMDGSSSHSVLLNCSFTEPNVGRLLNEYYAKGKLLLKEL